MVNPVATVKIAGLAASVFCHDLQVERKVTVSEDEDVKWMFLQHIPAVLEEPFSFRSGELCFGFFP